MSLDAATVRRIARLARIRVDDDEVQKLQGELNAILGYVEQLGEVDVEGVEPLSGGAQMALRQREDVVTDGEIAEKILANAPDRELNFFSVPKVVE
jgi:aspartyl-tRNA(Asn)/glutamyl-tRNA(Gln) amidotransferase subunit C